MYTIGMIFAEKLPGLKEILKYLKNEEMQRQQKWPNFDFLR